MKKMIGGMLLYVAAIVSGCSKETTSEEGLLTKAELSHLLYDYKEFRLLENYTPTENEIDLFQKQGYSGEHIRVFDVLDTRTREIRKMYEIGGDGYIYADDLVYGVNSINFSDKISNTDISLEG